MKTKVDLTEMIAALLLAATSVGHAGTGKEAAEEPAADPWIEPVLDIRARYEYGDVEGLDASHSLTTRERIGLATAEWHGLSAMVEGEFTQAVVDDYTVLQPGMTPFNPSDTPIGDPETNELNRAWVQWHGYDTKIKGGRQRIILDDAQWVGDVGWRQNEQTFDGISLNSQRIDDLTVFYSYLNRANRIFGSDATGAGRSFAGDVHLLNARYEGIESTTVVGYAYLMDFDETAGGFPGMPNYVSNNTYGATVTTKLDDWTLRAEAAFQTEAASSSAGVDNSTFLHFDVDYGGLDRHHIALGWRYLGKDLVQPLSTAHAFNGFADVFLARQVGTAYNPGLNDLHLQHKWDTPFWGIQFLQAVHLFGDNDTAFDFGWEYDAVLSKRFNENWMALAKFAFYESSGPTGKATNFAPLADTTRITVEMNYTF